MTISPEAYFLAGWASEQLIREHLDKIPILTRFRDGALTSASDHILGYHSSDQARREHQRTEFWRAIRHLRIRTQMQARGELPVMETTECAEPSPSS